MNEPSITLQGWVGGDVEVRTVGETRCASFRVGTTPRYNKNGTWVDGTTSWFTVDCWRSLGRNVAESVRKGDAVIVRGRVRVDQWERSDGQGRAEAWTVEASFVGLDLTRGTGSFVKTVPSGPDPVPAQVSTPTSGPVAEAVPDPVSPAA